MTLRVYNTLTRQKEDFQTLVPGQVRMYLCGPTVYKPAHIGHMVGPVIFDTVKRYLTYNGYQVKFVINITDVDDKLINRARENKTTVEALARRDDAGLLRQPGLDRRRHGRRVSLRDAAHRRHAEDHRPADRKRLRLSARRRRLFRGHQGPRLRQAQPPQRRRNAGRDARRSQRPQTQSGRLRPVEEIEAGRAGLGQPLGAGAAPAGTSSARP